MSSEFTTIPGSGDDFRASVEELKRTIPLMEELAPQIASMRKKLYDAHIEAGFSPTEALVLCKTMTL